MKITIYELLGLIKDGKAPKKIKIDETIFERTSSSDITQMYNYWNRGYNHFWLTTYTILLDDEVEILDEEDEFIDIEEIDVALLGQCDNWLRCPTNEVTKQNIELNPYIIDNVRENTLGFQHKINDLIKNQKKIINKLKEEGK